MITQLFGQSQTHTSATQPLPVLAPDPNTGPLSEAAAARKWRDYLLDNRVRIRRNADTKTARLILAEISRHMEAALANPGALQRESASAFDAILEAGKIPDACRPTLYDFVVFEAIDFYRTDAQSAFALAAPGNRFRPRSAVAAGGNRAAVAASFLGSMEDFLAWKPAPDFAPPPVTSPNSSDAASGDLPLRDPTLRIVQLFQDLLRFHHDDPAPQLALADADFHRIAWAASLLGEPAAEQHRATLRAFIKRFADTPIASAACAVLAEQLRKNDPATAHAAATEGVRLHPDSPYANDCRDILTHIEAPALLSITTEHTWTAPSPDITVYYRNHRKIHFRAIPWDWEDFATARLGYLEKLTSKDLAEILSRAPSKSWTAALPETADNRYREGKISAPRTLAPGFYFLAASLDEKFSDKKNSLYCVPVWVGDVAIVHNPSNDERVHGFVVNARTGEPVSNAIVSLWRTAGARAADDIARSDSDGAFTLTPTGAVAWSTDRFAIHARVSGNRETDRAIATAISIGINPHWNENMGNELVDFFTDSALYKAGQTIRFKAIAFRQGKTSEAPALLPNRELPVILRGPGGEIAGPLKVRTNDHGSAAGEFVLPAECASGMYYISTDFGVSQINGSTHVNVVNDDSAPSVAQNVFTAPENKNPALVATVTADEWQTADAPVLLTLATTTPDNLTQSTRGTVFIHPLQQPKTIARTDLVHFENPHALTVPSASPAATIAAATATPTDADPARNWPEKRAIVRKDFVTDAKTGIAKISAKLPAGIYRAIVTAHDKTGAPVNARAEIRVVKSGATRPAINEDILLVAPAWKAHASGTFTALWASGHDDARACIIIEQNGKTLSRTWTKPGVTQQQITIPVTASMRGGVTLSVFQIHGNRFVTRTRDIAVPWDSERLHLTWENLNDRPASGTRETWTARIQTTSGARTDIEAVGLLHDDSLQENFRHEWPALAGAFSRNIREYPMRTTTNLPVAFVHVVDTFPSPAFIKTPPQTYRHWKIPASKKRPPAPPEEIPDAPEPSDGAVAMEKYIVTADRLGSLILAMPTLTAASLRMPALMTKNPGDPNGTLFDLTLGGRKRTQLAAEAARATPGSTLFRSAQQFPRPPVFFLPQLQGDAKGRVRFEFTAPEAGTRWKFVIFAHDKALRTVSFSDTIVTPE